MKFKLMMAVIIVGFCLTGITGMTGQAYSDDHVSEKTIKVGNKICPISKMEAGGMGPITEYEHEGKIYNFCCPMCITAFKKDPEKYIKMIEETMAAEEVQTEGAHEGHDH